MQERLKKKKKLILYFGTKKQLLLFFFSNNYLFPGGMISIGVFGGFVFLAAVITVVVILVKR